MASETTTQQVSVEPKPLESLTPTQYDHWRLTGEIPAEGEVEAPPKTEAAPGPVTEPEPVKAPVVEPKKPSKMGYGDLRRALAEKDAEIERLKAAPKAEVKEIVSEPKEKAEKLRARPRSTDKNEKGEAKYATWEDYEDDLLSWNGEKIRHELKQEQVKESRERSVEQQNKAIEDSWRSRVQEARKAHADFDTVALDEANGPGKGIAKGSLLDQWLMNSEHGAELLYYFGQKPAELQRVGNLTPLQAMRELTRLEDRMNGTSSTATVKEPEVRVTKAPRPASEVGGRGTNATDEVTKAVADDDVRAYINAANRRELASSKR